MKQFRIKTTITDRTDASLGIFFKEVSRIPLLTREEETELGNKAKNGDIKAQNELVTHNLRFVISVAKAFQGKGLDLVDLIQEAVLGCKEAASKFDPDRGFKFISYAVWWIRQAIIQALANQSRTVRVPVNQVVSSSKINRAISKFEQEHGRQPSNLELEELTEYTADKIANTSLTKSVSLESPVTDADDVSCLLDIIPSSTEPTDNNLVGENVSDIVEKILNKLSYRERDVLRLFYGIGTQSMSITDISHYYGVSNERIRQVLHKALDKLKAKYGDKLKELL